MHRACSADPPLRMGQVSVWEYFPSLHNETLLSWGVGDCGVVDVSKLWTKTVEVRYRTTSESYALLAASNIDARYQHIIWLGPRGGERRYKCASKRYGLRLLATSVTIASLMNSGNSWVVE